MKAILILGGSSRYVHAVKRAKALGLRTVVADRNPQCPAATVSDAFYPVDIVDRDAVLAVARAEQIAGVLALNDYGVPTAAVVAKELGLPGISPEVAANATSKLAMRKIWSEKQVPSARFSDVTCIDKVKNAAKEIGYPIIVKPACSLGGGSRGVSLVTHERELPGAVVFAQEYYEDKTVLVEEYLVGSEYSVEVLVWRGTARILGIGENVKNPPPYRVNKKIVYPAEMEPEKLSESREAIESALIALGMTQGMAHVEFCMTKTGPKLIEIGARCGGGSIPGSVIYEATGVSVIDQAIRLSVGLKPEGLRAIRNRFCVYHFLTPPPGRLEAISGLDAALSVPGVVDIELFKSPGDEIGPLRTGLDRAGAVIACREDRKEAEYVAVSAEERIVFKYDESRESASC